MAMLIQDELSGEFVGKTIVVDLSNASFEEYDLQDWGIGDVDDEEIWHVVLDYRDYSAENGGYDDFDEDYDDDEENDYDDEDEFAEDNYWEIETGITFVVKSNVIKSIEITADITGDSGLGDSSPEDEWSNDDYEAAKDFFMRIV